MQVWLRVEGEEYPIDLADLDESVRQGAVSGDAEVLHPPWTGASYRRLRDLVVMAEALDAPSARFADYLRQRRPAWLTGALSAMVMGSAMVQAALAGSERGWAEQRLHATFHQWLVGLEPTLLDGRWWTPWTSQLVHSDLLHAVFNVPILAYCGYRVEQALAPSGALAVVAAAVLLGAVAIVGGDASPVVGSSIAAYGLWSAQIAIGLRMNEAVPRDLRGRYGMGNLIFFAPLYAASLFNTEVSQLGHLGAIVGGALMTFFLTAETMVSQKDHARARRRVLALTALLCMAPAPLLATARRLPQLAYAPYTAVSPADAGLTLRLPDRMAEHPSQIGGISAWQASSTSPAPLFADLFFLETPQPTTTPWLLDWWSRHLGAPATALPAPPPPPPGEGWTSHAFQVGAFTVIEHQLRRGRWLVRAGYLLPPTTAARAPFAGRRRLYAHILQGIQVAAPPTLAAARAQHAADPDNPLLSLALARELRHADLASEADALLAAVEDRAGGWQWEAARERLTLWLDTPPPGAREERRAWLLRYLGAAQPIDHDIHLRGIRWLATNDACTEARLHRQKLDDALLPADLIAELDGLLLHTCP